MLFRTVSWTGDEKNEKRQTQNSGEGYHDRVGEFFSFPDVLDAEHIVQV
jgi:hypothetical protein